MAGDPHVSYARFASPLGRPKPITSRQNPQVSVGLHLRGRVNFKRINDEFGHAVGDQAIQAVASCLSAELRLTDAVGRYGGEEFCLMFPRTTLAEAPNLAERLRIQVEAEAGQRVRTASRLVITVSCGISSTVFGARTPLELIDQADKALYAAKEGGRNCVMTLDPITVGANPSAQFEPQVRRVTPRVSSPKASQ